MVAYFQNYCLGASPPEPHRPAPPQMNAGSSQTRGRPMHARPAPQGPRRRPPVTHAVRDIHSYAVAAAAAVAPGPGDSDDSDGAFAAETLQQVLKQEEVVVDDGDVEEGQVRYAYSEDDYGPEYAEAAVDGTGYCQGEDEEEGGEGLEGEMDGETVETYYYTEDGDIVTDTGEIAGYIESGALPHVQVHEGEMGEEQGEEMEVAFKCTVCSDSFFTYEDLRVHSDEQHVASMFKCARCDKMFRGHGNWWRHMKSHTDDPKYRFPCHICRKVFTQKANMMKHMNIHLGVKNFRCTVCGKAFGQKANLNKHILVHSGALLHGCEVCGKRFSQKANLKKHNQIHTGEYSFECDICHKKFIQKINCQKHMRTHRDLVVRADCKLVGPPAAAKEEAEDEEEET